MSPFLPGHSGHVLLITTLVHGVFDTQDAACGRAAGREGCRTGGHRAQKVTLGDAEATSRLGFSLQAVVANARSVKAARLLLYSFICGTRRPRCLFRSIPRDTMGVAQLTFQGPLQRRPSGELRKSEDSGRPTLPTLGAQENQTKLLLCSLKAQG